MNFGLKQIRVKTPKVVMWIAGVALAVNVSITGVAVWADNELMQKIGGTASLVALVLPKLFGVKEEQKNEEPIG